ncbi:PepSY domain-containing protein [Thiocystis violacea]|uniref:PepSY domain-containing protein n=1 Tax=Thiocystis violacea TaxID=13725 RepID=UPI0019089282|nr:PepSY domain-containing protein [Thiocystis violacea]MBK1724781.1 hypothetical protein [Thiocystis violacea]
MKRHIPILFLALVSAAGTAVAGESVSNALASGDANISLTEAISAAEQHVGGRAAFAEYEQAKDQWVYEVFVLKDKTVMEVMVDPASGAVISAAEASDD